MTVDEIMEALAAILASADGEDRELTDEEVERYEELEGQLQAAQRSAQVRARHAAYSTPVGAPGVHIAPAQEDDTLERAYDAYLRTGQANQDITELRAQGEGTGAAGGYAVPPGFRQRIIDRMVAFGGFAQETDSFSTTTGNAIEYPTLDDTANEGDITAEGTAPTTGADLTFGKISLGAYKYTAAGPSGAPIRVSLELVQDSAFDIRGLVSRKMGERIARKQAAHWVTGTGVAQPKGILAASLTQDVDLDTADTLTYADFVDIQDQLDEAYEPNAKWLMRKNTWAQARLVVDGNGRPIIQDALSGISGKPAKMILGSEVIIDEATPLLSSAGITFPIAYGDFREAYVRRMVSTMVIMANPYTRQSEGEIEYTAWMRADGNIQNRNAYVVVRNNT